MGRGMPVIAEVGTSFNDPAYTAFCRKVYNACNEIIQKNGDPLPGEHAPSSTLNAEIMHNLSKDYDSKKKSRGTASVASSGSCFSESAASDIFTFAQNVSRFAEDTGFKVQEYISTSRELNRNLDVEKLCDVMCTSLKKLDRTGISNRKRKFIKACETRPDMRRVPPIPEKATRLTGNALRDALIALQIPILDEVAKKSLSSKEGILVNDLKAVYVFAYAELAGILESRGHIERLMSAIDKNF